MQRRSAYCEQFDLRFIILYNLNNASTFFTTNVNKFINWKLFEQFL